MNELKADCEVEALAQALEVSPSGFYAHQHKVRRPRAQADQQLAAKIQTIFEDSRRTYGSPRVCAALRRPLDAGKSFAGAAEAALCAAHHAE